MSVGGAMFVTGGTVLTIGLVENTRGTTPTANLRIHPFGASFQMQF